MLGSPHECSDQMCDDLPENADRRRSLSLLGGGAILMGFWLVGVARGQGATRPTNQAGASAQRVSESDPLAQSLGYNDDASKVNKAKYPTFKSGEKCSKCRFFQGAGGQPYGPCQIFSGKMVNSNGWCSSYNAKS